MPTPAPHALAVAVLLAVLLVPVCVIDLRERRIPNRLTGPGAVAALVIGQLLDPAGQSRRIVAALAVVLFLLALRAPRPTGLGLGDVKLAGVLGLALGPAVAVALLAALVAGGAAAVVIGPRTGPTALRTATVPFGPFLAGGAAVALTAGDPLLAGYLAALG